MLNGIQKFFAVSRLGRDSFNALLPFKSRCAGWPMSTAPIKIILFKKRARSAACISLSVGAVGPRLPARQDLFNKAAGFQRSPVLLKTESAPVKRFL